MSTHRGGIMNSVVRLGRICETPFLWNSSQTDIKTRMSTLNGWISKQNWVDALVFYKRRMESVTFCRMCQKEGFRGETRVSSDSEISGWQNWQQLGTDPTRFKSVETFYISLRLKERLYWPIYVNYSIYLR